MGVACASAVLASLVQVVGDMVGVTIIHSALINKPCIGLQHGMTVD